MSCLTNPPKPGEPSHALHQKEREVELASLRRRAHMVTDGFNELEGVTCNFTEGAMYSFPQVRSWASVAVLSLEPTALCLVVACDGLGWLFWSGSTHGVLMSPVRSSVHVAALSRPLPTCSPAPSQPSPCPHHPASPTVAPAPEGH